MPIPADLRRQFYSGAKWKEYRAAIIARAGNCCEFCGKPGQRWVVVTRDNTSRWNHALASVIGPTSALTWLTVDLLRTLKQLRGAERRAAFEAWEQWHRPAIALEPVLTYPQLEDLRRQHGQSVIAPPPEAGRLWLVCRVLGVAHLNQVPGDDRMSNGAALCEPCHLRYDKQQHFAARCARKDLARPILTLATGRVDVAAEKVAAVAQAPRDGAAGSGSSSSSAVA